MLARSLKLLCSVDSIAYIEFKTEEEADRMLEVSQGAEVQGRTITVDFVGDKSQRGKTGSGKIHQALVHLHLVMLPDMMQTITS